MENFFEPGPLQVIEADEENHSFILNTEALTRILERPEVAESHVAVISVAGAFRKGKSFLLNFFLRYLRHLANGGRADDSNWLGDERDHLKGFSWCGGSERHTSGILLWSEPFVFNFANGKQIVVLLMDTQGAFDSQSTVKECATVFALTTMLSSLQIYNLTGNIQEDDLQHLQLFTEYGRLASQEQPDEIIKPFQTLMFLVRDWAFPYEAEYGPDGGARLLDRRLATSDKQHPELQQLRKHIRQSFDQLSCWLLPHPGLRVATNPDFQGAIGDLEPEFRHQLRILTPYLLAPDRLCVKKINGQPLTGSQLLLYFKSYSEIFKGETLPEPKSMLLATAEANNLSAVAGAKSLYCKQMELSCGGDTPFMAEDQLVQLHQRCRKEAFQHFKETRKMGGQEFSQQYLERLDSELEEQYENFVKHNNSKNLFKSAKTPAVLFTILLIVYFIKELAEFIGLDAAARAFSTFLGIVLLAICMWAYVRQSGHMRELGQMIDETADFIWTNFMAPAMGYATQQAVQHSINRSLSQHSNGNNRAELKKRQ